MAWFFGKKGNGSTGEDTRTHVRSSLDEEAWYNNQIRIVKRPECQTIGYVHDYRARR